MMVNMNTPLI